MTVAKGRVLLVEDEALIALDTHDALTEAGYEVVGPASTIDIALRMAEEPLDAAVLDVNIAGVLVWPVAERLASRGVPLVLLTGFGAALEVPEAVAHAPRLGKPIDPRELFAALDGLAAGSGSQRE